MNIQIVHSNDGYSLKFIDIDSGLEIKDIVGYDITSSNYTDDMLIRFTVKCNQIFHKYEIPIDNKEKEIIEEKPFDNLILED